VKLTFVTPWYGADVTGGAETQARATAEALRRIGGLDVDVWTTCAQDFHSDWSGNARPEGLEDVNGVPVLRFPVQKRDAPAFDAVNIHLMHNRPVTAEMEQVFLREMIHSPALYEAIRRDTEGRVFLFIPYMFGTTFEGAAIHPDRSVLIPCLHDESYAYLPRYARMFEEVRGVIFLTAAERRLAERLYRMRPGAAAVLGGGIDTDSTFDGQRFRQTYGLDDFLLYVGRKEAGKNVPLLIQYFSLYKRRYPSDLKLVLIGKGEIAIPPDSRDDIVDLGFLSEQDKHDAYAAAIALCQPSRNESFSIVMMEAWLTGTPALVVAECEVTREHCLDANGGLYFSNAREFAEEVEWLRHHPAPRRIMGGYGRRYVLERFNWDAIVHSYIEALAGWGIDRARRPVSVEIMPGPLDDLREAHQLVAGFRQGDAISQMALVIQKVLRSWGLASEIIAEHVPSDARRSASLLQEFASCIHPRQLLIYHYSLDSAATDVFLHHAGKKLLLYQNITPAHFFAGYSEAHLRLARSGRERLPAVIRASHLCMGGSRYNCLELEEYGAVDPRVLPVLPDLENLLHTDPDPDVMGRFGGDTGRHGPTVIFVGRLSPNKRQDNVIRAFWHYRHTFEPRARLIFVGGFGPERYLRELRGMVGDMGLSDAVTFADYVDDRTLAAYYRVADVYLSMSEHEGCGVPLIEAMRFDIPVVAYAAAAVPYTLGDGGVLIHDRDPNTVAAVLNQVRTEPEFRKAVLSRQRRRLEDFAPAKVAAMLQSYVEEVLSA
jgi:glycosyltransferase involved in cell wall biosynthesis